MADLDPKALNRAVFAYDDARCAAHGGDRPMSAANRTHITPMIAAAIQSYLAALPKGEPVAEVAGENALEDAAKAAFTQAQSVYRGEHDHFPLKHTWETTYESVREGWRKIAHAAVEAAAMPPVGTQPEPRRPRPIRSALVAAPPAGDER